MDSASPTNYSNQSAASSVVAENDDATFSGFTFDVKYKASGNTVLKLKVPTSKVTNPESDGDGEKTADTTTNNTANLLLAKDLKWLRNRIIESVQSSHSSSSQQVNLNYAQQDQRHWATSKVYLGFPERDSNSDEKDNNQLHSQNNFVLDDTIGLPNTLKLKDLIEISKVPNSEMTLLCVIIAPHEKRYPNGDIYVGDLILIGHDVDSITTKKHGYGIMCYDNGTVYEGEWEYDVWHGKGKVSDANAIYEGEFSMGTACGGDGRIKYKDHVGLWHSVNC